MVYFGVASQILRRCKIINNLTASVQSMASRNASSSLVMLGGGRRGVVIEEGAIRVEDPLRPELE